MLYKYVAIPAKYLDPQTGYLKSDLTPEEAAYVAANFGQQPLSAEDLAERATDEAAVAANLKPTLKAKLAEIRYNTVDAGFELGGVRILCDTRTTAYLTAIFIEAQADPAFTVQWKAPTGFVTLTSAMIAQISRAARGYVQKCFDAEAAVLAKIESGEVTSDAQMQAAFQTTLASLLA